jgi:folate-binding protein YgfZ
MTSEIKIALLADRGVISVEGADAGKFLQGLVTNDVAKLQSEPAIHTGLLSPQGKILFEFFVVKDGGKFLIDVARDRVADLIKRLTLYKLRAAVTIADVSKDVAVYADFGGETVLDRGIVYRDPRQAELGNRVIITDGPEITATVDAQAYHAHRVALAVPEGGRDYIFGDAFPHEARFDELGGVSFSKGCFVGQEVVSRMEHRGTARKRVVPVSLRGGTLAEGASIQAGGVEIGRIGTVAGQRALALLRLDRADEFAAKGVPLMAGDATVTVDLPPGAYATPAPA